MTEYTFYYFPVRGRGEAIRMLWADVGASYEEINVAPSVEVWQQQWKHKMPFGQAPMVKHGDQELVQSNAILRYLGRKYDLYGDGPLEQYRMDMLTDHVEDIRSEYSRMIYHNYDNGKDEYIKSIPTKFAPVEKFLKSWGNEYIGKKISFADYNLCDLLDIHEVLSPGCLAQFPSLTAYHARVLARPHIQAYRKSEGFKTRPINFNGKQ
ncbi:glutathione S-transferase P-like [Dreissena polymorpha]|nr:glutathione S-transferase P-like [Dreissena polymorpha]